VVKNLKETLVEISPLPVGLTDISE